MMRNYLALMLALASLTLMPDMHSLLFRPVSYAQILGGPNWCLIREKERRPTTDCAGQRRDIKLKTRTGFMAGFALGYRFCNGLRIEEEYTFRENRVIAKRNFSVRTADGCLHPVKAHTRAHTQTSAVLANLIWELPLSCTPFTPYFGGGAGYGWNSARLGSRNKLVVCGEKIKTKNCHRRQNSRGFAWQGIAGFSFPVGCNADLAIEYRYFRSTSKLRNNSCVVVSKYSF